MTIFLECVNYRKTVFQLKMCLSSIFFEVFCTDKQVLIQLKNHFFENSKFSIFCSSFLANRFLEKKNTLWLLSIIRVQLSQGCRSTARKHFTVDLFAPRILWYSSDPTWKNERLNQPWSQCFWAWEPWPKNSAP